MGGAFLRMIGCPCEDNFPGDNELRDGLMLCAELDTASAAQYAEDIINANDSDNIEEAFDLLEAAIG